MNMPDSLRYAIQEESNNIKHSDLLKNAQIISERYRFESGHNKQLLTSETEAIAYIVSRMPATFGVTLSALQKSLSLLTDMPLTLLDIGAGTGAASWAADMLLPLKKITCLEREIVMIDLGKKLSKAGSSVLLNAEWIKCDILTQNIDIKADLVIASYVLNEFTPLERQKVIDKIWNATNQLLLIVEPGTPEAFKQMKINRNYLLSKGAYMVAPCPHQLECPLLENDWCSFYSRIARTQLHKELKGGVVPYEDEKFTYLAFSKEKVELCKNRILRHPLIKPKMITLDLCTEKGKKQITLTKSDGEIYKCARKCNAGDEINL